MDVSAKISGIKRRRRRTAGGSVGRKKIGSAWQHVRKRQQKSAISAIFKNACARTLCCGANARRHLCASLRTLLFCLPRNACTASPRFLPASYPSPLRITASSCAFVWHGMTRQRRKRAGYVVDIVREAQTGVVMVMAACGHGTADGSCGGAIP